MAQDINDPVVHSMPSDWTGEQQKHAKNAAVLLLRHYPGWAWQIEFTDVTKCATKDYAMLIRMGDVLTETIYIVQHKDITDEKIIRAGGEFLEALGLSRTRNRHDEIHGLKKTAGGILVPDYGACPVNNPGFAKIKKQFANLR